MLLALFLTTRAGAARAIPISPSPFVLAASKPTGAWNTRLVDDGFLPVEPLCPANPPQVIHRLCPMRFPPLFFRAGAPRALLCMCPDNDATRCEAQRVEPANDVRGRVARPAPREGHQGGLH